MTWRSYAGWALKRPWRIQRAELHIVVAVIQEGTKLRISSLSRDLIPFTFDYLIDAGALR
jgi:hypothetical protein